MAKYICLLLVLIHIDLFCGERLPMKYCISYGKAEAKVMIVEYFSFGCPQCINLFKEDFLAIREKYCDSGRVCYIFHPDPADILTIQAMMCLSRLSESRKRIFLETILVELENVDNFTGSLFMKKAMEVFHDPLPDLDKYEFIKSAEAFKDAFRFLSQPRYIKGVPTVEINGRVYEDFPKREFLEKEIMILEEKK